MRKINLLLAGLAMSIAVGGCSGEKTKETELTETETVKTEVLETEITEAETSGTEVSETETKEAETSGTEVSETETKEAETSGTEISETEAKETEASETEVPGTETKEEETEESPGVEGVFGVFETQTLDGEAVDQSIFTEADLTMVNIWGTFCTPCIQEMPDLAELSEEYADKGVRLIGIVSDILEPGDEAAQKIIDATKADYTHLVLSESLWTSYLSRVQAVPTTVFVDREGKQVGQAYVGSRSKEEWSAIVDEKLEKIAQ